MYQKESVSVDIFHRNLESVEGARFRNLNIVIKTKCQVLVYVAMENIHAET